MKALFIAVAAQLLRLGYAQSRCPSPSGSIRPSVASGYALQVVATGLAGPRGVVFDDRGQLLVVEQTTGTITSHVVNEAGGCATVMNTTTVVGSGLSLNHGIWINGSTLYASNVNSVYSWTYNSAARSVSNQQMLITGMNNTDHQTRTLVLSQKVPGMLIVSRGSSSNLDLLSAAIDEGPAQVRAFNLNNRTGVYDWKQGLLLAWGVRNEVGLVEHPISGGIYGVENSADQITRDGVDVSNNNPGEELNFFGYLNGTTSRNQGSFFGYPWCLSVWNTTELPNSRNLTVGNQFAFDQNAALGNQNRTDQYCAAEATNARLVFQAHMAPLDIKFNNSGTEAWITFHGSWDRVVGVGYKLSMVQFKSNGDPVAASDSTTAAVDIVSNQNNSVCPDNCLRPVGLAFDTRGRIFMTSDSSGEIYIVSKEAGSNGTNGTAPAASGTSTASRSASATAASAATMKSASNTIWYSIILGLLAFCMV